MKEPSRNQVDNQSLELAQSEAPFGEITFGGFNTQPLPSSHNQALDVTFSDNVALLQAISARSFGSLDYDKAAMDANPGDLALSDKQFERLREAKLRPVVKRWKLWEHGITKESLRDPSNECAQAFKRYIFHSKRVWDRMKRQGESVAFESIDYLLELAKQPGAHLVELVAEPLHKPSDYTPSTINSLFYALLTVGRENIHDADDLPLPYRTEGEITRLQNIFTVNDGSGLFFPKGFLAEVGISEVKAIAAEIEAQTDEPVPILTRIMVEPAEYAYTASLRALTGRGFRGLDAKSEFDGILHPVPGIRDKEQTIKGVDQWFVYEPGVTTEQEQKKQAAIVESRRWVKERIVLGHYFPPAYSRLAIWRASGNDNEAYLFGEQQSRNTVAAVELIPNEQHPYRENVDYIEGDSSGTVFPDNSIDGHLFLNVLPEVASTGKHESPEENILEFLSNALKSLRVDQIAAIRDWVIPHWWPETVVLQIPLRSEGATKDLKEMSSKDFFEHYAAVAYEGKGIPHENLGRDQTGTFELIRVSRAEGLKFPILNEWRKTEDVTTSINRPFGLFTQLGAVNLGRQLECRVRQTRFVYNDWVREHVLEQGIKVLDSSGNWLGYPPNQFELVLQKIDTDAGVAVKAINARPVQNPKYLRSRFFKYGEEIRQYVSRKDKDVYLVYPVYEIDGEVYTRGRDGYPRGIPQVMLDKMGKKLHRDFALTQSIASGHGAEAIPVVRAEDETPAQAIRRGLIERALIREEEIPDDATLTKLAQHLTLPSPGSVDELRREVVIPVSPSSHVISPERSHSGLPSRGVVKPFRLSNILDMAPNSPLASMPVVSFAYREMYRRKKSVPDWNGPKIELTPQLDPGLKITSAEELFSQPEPFLGPRWQEIEDPGSDRHFYEIWRGTFVELDGSGQIICDEDGKPIFLPLEFATTAEGTLLSNNTITTLPVMNVEGRILVAFQIRKDIPLVEEVLKQHSLPCTPASRITNDLPKLNTESAITFGVEKMESELGLRATNNWTLGPELPVAAGMLAERLLPTATEVSAQSVKNANVVVCDLEDVLKWHSAIRDGQTLGTVFRLGHALGKLRF